MRPEAIKMAPLIKAFQKHPDKFEIVVCGTDKHRQSPNVGGFCMIKNSKSFNRLIILI